MRKYRKYMVGGFLAFTLLLTQGAPLFAQGTPQDDKLYDKVRMKLAEDRDVNGGGIEVSVHNGVVTLKGKVLREKQRTRAATVAKKVKGVVSVDNQLVTETK
jgi:osmotically-inducible protein OsmY